ncbi:threonine aldolase [Synergistales bacterium]|nr:threonine aldolase [Synergistales bacterium]
MFDFRSDTVTQPTEAMREAMAVAAVGDDVYGDDPTVNELQDYAAGLLGMEAAIYMCSGTMGNLIAIMSHCSRGDGVLMGVNSHTWRNEVGNVASVAGVMPYPLDDAAGCPTIESIRKFYQPSGNVHRPITTLMTLENTHNGAGGVPTGAAPFAAAADEARSLGMKVHVDGARIFDAVARLGVDVKDYSSKADSVQFCLSKGLGAPMGSILCGERDFIDKARKYRKALGGGQRQVGIAAAAGLIALREMRGRLSEDHENAALLAELLKGCGIDVEDVPNRTNMVFFNLTDGQCDAQALIKRCKARGLLIGSPGGRRVRMVTHLGIGADDVRSAAEIIKKAAPL